MTQSIGISEKTSRKNPINPNLLTANQATCTNALGTTAGFLTYDGTCTKTSSTDHPFKGSKSLKTVTNGDAPPERIYTDPAVSVTAGQPYTASAQVYAPLNRKMRLDMYSSSLGAGQHIFFTGTGTWQSVTATFTATDTGIFIFIGTDTDTSATTFYVGELILRKGTY